MSTLHPSITDSRAVLQQNLERIQEQISCAAMRAHQSIPHILAVTKTQPVALVELAYSLGLRDFGENYVSEALEKISALQLSVPNHQAVWHFIGPIQSNKTRLIATHFDWAHGVDRLKIAQRLSEQRGADLGCLQVCIQINISGEANKSGCAPQEALALALEVSHLPHLQLRGLMCVPAALDADASFEARRAPFDAMRDLFEQIRAALPQAHAAAFDTLSMGMSGDFEAAIGAGSTMVRIGSALFGARA